VRQTLTEEHVIDEDGHPSGGATFAEGLSIRWQEGPLGRGEDRVAPNGAFVETVIAAARGRLAFYQRVSGGRFACEENALAIEALDAAAEALEARTRDREAREVEGTHQP
jgi:hypothetical protein